MGFHCWVSDLTQPPGNRAHRAAARDRARASGRRASRAGEGQGIAHALYRAGPMLNREPRRQNPRQLFNVI
eukprot:9491972-Pyramimonas_sp.AAC.3